MSGDRYHVPPTLPDDNMEDKSYSLSGKIMVSVILILFFLVVLLVSIHLYVRTRLLRARRRQLSRRLTGLNEAPRQSQIVFYVNGNPTTVTDPGNRGLESSVLSSLPVFVYSAKTHPEPLDCAVCLSELEENEKARYLPKCNHSFHIECIDMWFHSHSTCPLCRTPVEPITEPENIGFRFRESERITGNESSGTRSGFCVACRQEEGSSSMTSLGSRRRGLDMRIEVPSRNQIEDELTLISTGRGSRSPGTRLLSMRMKRLLSFGGRKTPTNERSTTPSAAGTSFTVGEMDLEKGPSELTPK